MIWYFLAGFVSGSVGVIKFSGWLVHRLEARMKEVEQHDECPDRPKGSMD